LSIFLFCLSVPETNALPVLVYTFWIFSFCYRNKLSSLFVFWHLFIRVLIRIRSFNCIRAYKFLFTLLRVFTAFSDYVVFNCLFSL
jgi:hypothetical protein